jgi:hypothetical protein
MGRTSLLRTLLLPLLFMIFAPVETALAADTAPVLPVAATQEARNKAVAGRVFEEIFNQGKFEVADEIYAKDFVNHGLHRNFDLQEDQAAVHAEKKAFPDLRPTASCWPIRDTIEVAAAGISFCGVDSYLGILQSDPETEANAACEGNVWSQVDNHDD